VQFDKEASQTRDYRVAKNATLRAVRPDSSRRKERLFGMTIKLHHHLVLAALVHSCPIVVSLMKGTQGAK
jgi:hypothetical protein